MKRTFLVLSFLLAVAAPAASQTQVRERRSTDNANPPANPSPTVRNRVVGEANRSNHASREEPRNDAPPAAAVVRQDEPKPAWGNSVVQIRNTPPAQPTA
ncbi:MAG TPA: hypothetical protein VIU65_04020, partial [Pyrinomonadaceae bacterium]